jgi:hypothetical protein
VAELYRANVIAKVRDPVSRGGTLSAPKLPQRYFAPGDTNVYVAHPEQSASMRISEISSFLLDRLT